jgi:hypothetical protein
MLQPIRNWSVQTLISLTQLFQEILPLNILKTGEICPMSDNKHDYDAGPTSHIKLILGLFKAPVTSFKMVYDRTASAY